MISYFTFSVPSSNHKLIGIDFSGIAEAGHNQLIGIVFSQHCTQRSRIRKPKSRMPWATVAAVVTPPVVSGRPAPTGRRRTTPVAQPTTQVPEKKGTDGPGGGSGQPEGIRSTTADPAMAPSAEPAHQKQQRVLHPPRWAHKHSHAGGHRRWGFPEPNVRR